MTIISNLLKKGIGVLPHKNPKKMWLDIPLDHEAYEGIHVPPAQLKYWIPITSEPLILQDIHCSIQNSKYYYSKDNPQIMKLTAKSFNLMKPRILSYINGEPIPSQYTKNNSHRVYSKPSTSAQPFNQLMENSTPRTREIYHLLKQKDLSPSFHPSCKNMIWISPKYEPFKYFAILFDIQNPHGPHDPENALYDTELKVYIRKTHRPLTPRDDSLCASVKQEIINYLAGQS